MRSAAVLALLALVIGTKADGGAASPWPDGYDRAVKAAFRDQGKDAQSKYNLLFAYLLTSFDDRQDASGSHATQPGEPSRHGDSVDAMEAYTRLAPLVAAWLSSGRPRTIEDMRGRSIDLLMWLRRGILAGTDPQSDGYWGDVHDLDQRVVEAADVARSVWIARTLLLPALSAAERHQIGQWLSQASRVQVPDNNWHLYPVLIDLVLAQMGETSDLATADKHFKRFVSFRLGDGWYSDGPSRDAVDWYNAWGIQYELWWIRQIAPGYGGPQIGSDIRSYLGSFPYLIGREGIPIMGRSVCYRMAAPAPLIAASIPAADQSPDVNPGMARRALDSIWSYFISVGGVAGGVITQGYCQKDLRILDNYSGPSSCLWSLRSLVLAFMMPTDAAFWTAPEAPLPIEEKSYDIKVPSTGWEIVGRKETGEIEIFPAGRHANQAASASALEPYSWWRMIASKVLWRPFRPDNNDAKYHREVYSSKKPFCGCLGKSDGNERREIGSNS